MVLAVSGLFFSWRPAHQWKLSASNSFLPISFSVRSFCLIYLSFIWTLCFFILLTFYLLSILCIFWASFLTFPPLWPLQSLCRVRPAIYSLFLMLALCLFLCFSRTHLGQCYLLSVTFYSLLGFKTQNSTVPVTPIASRVLLASLTRSPFSSGATVSTGSLGYGYHSASYQLTSVLIPGSSSKLSHLANSSLRHGYAIVLADVSFHPLISMMTDSAVAERAGALQLCLPDPLSISSWKAKTQYSISSIIDSCLLRAPRVLFLWTIALVFWVHLKVCWIDASSHYM